ncbi:hypothetical protein [Desulfopila aestuarii]|uniref:Phage virion morphogenesis (Putative tail completion) protein n=1 Tax=Desulfopila aestuarii DSM 18488 TaxID=1121416 RepID=A0A1M7YJS1_9BACT|nr:hypothetical protein [Desulfopila aestuarii]SHO52853.1 hypothetical protein SAMN02745220_04801 [Desulfopila aestuarii DSM 18488]
MSGIVSIDIRDGISPELHRLLKKSRNLSPAMRKIEETVMKPLKRRAWQKSGLRADTGELRDAVETWHGKKSAGISVHTSPGKDLVIPKATLQTQGAKRGQYRGKDRYRVRQHTRGGRTIKAHTRRNTGSPWGNVKARKFIPTDLGTAGTEAAIRILEEYIDV